MAEYTVLTPFNTPTRRFAAGQKVDGSELEGPLTLDDRIRLGQIAAPKPAKAAKAAPAADQAETPAG
ncbi:hypothetical protein [Azospirillum picis]|uniref:Mu-like prophage FluMu N-terminal domain-containing protein n=1 Tax=Azospirillum picis TaxID=488438 RepID=A0ABU0MRZ2_9PROT|nr:hypothetical protein [Azospirillum picis]MBP2302523.1 hypothetical protein [Azospirillum picis]MDQ0536235.1 hypothetical protein [Azospirillum picis]